MTAVYREVKILQEDLKDNNAYNGPITGRFDLATFNGIKALINSGKLGPPIELPEPNEDAYGSVVAAVADELNYMPSAVNAVRSAYSEWARGAQSMYVTPAVLSDFGSQDPAVTGAVMTLQTVLSATSTGTANRPSNEPFYNGPVDGVYTAAVEAGFRPWVARTGFDLTALLRGDITIPTSGFTGPVLRAISSARNAFLRTQTSQNSRQQAGQISRQQTGTTGQTSRQQTGTTGQTSRQQTGTTGQTSRQQTGTTGQTSRQQTGTTRTQTANTQARNIASVADVAIRNAQNAAARAEEARRKAADTANAQAQAVAEQAAKEAEAKALAAQATIDAANAAAEAARLRAAEEAATARAALDTATQAAINQANALQTAAAQAAQEAAAKVAAAQEALRYAQTQSQQPTPAYYPAPPGPAQPPPQEEESEQPPEDQTPKEVTPARQEMPVEIKTAETPTTPWTKYFLIAAVAAAAVGGWWYYKNRATAETAGFEEDEKPCPCSRKHGMDDED
jgi:hypothetical protein